MWAVRGLLSQLVAAVDRVCADAVVVGFDDPAASVRRERWPTYKAHRGPKPRDAGGAAGHARRGAPRDRRRGRGAARAGGRRRARSARRLRPTVGARTVVATSDRDSFALIGEHTRMLRILNGGVDASPLLDPQRLVMVTGVRPDQYLDYAALRGDASDNLPGVPGHRPQDRRPAARGVRLRRARPSTTRAATATRCRAVAGRRRRPASSPTRPRASAWQLNCAGDDDASPTPPLGLDLAAGVGCLPLDEAAVRATFARLELHVPTAVRALTGKEPSAPQPRRRRRRLAATAAPAARCGFPPLRPSSPSRRTVQETLF